MSSPPAGGTGPGPVRPPDPDRVHNCRNDYFIRAHIYAQHGMPTYDVVRNRRSGYAHADSLSSGEHVTSMDLRAKIANRYCAPSRYVLSTLPGIIVQYFPSFW